MSSYGVFADFYDGLIELTVDYKTRAGYILDVLKKHNHPAGLTLDLACGTGSLTILLKKLGVDIYGIDGSNEMLSIAQEKAADEQLDILFLRQQMQELDLYGTIDTCVCTLDSLNHITDIDDVQTAFDRVSLFMNQGGLFVFDVNTVYKHQKILADNIFVYDSDEVYCVWINSLKENNVVNIDLQFFIPRGEVYVADEEHFSERAYSGEELAKMLTKAGFAIEAVYDDMTFNEIRDDSQRAVYVARKL